MAPKTKDMKHYINNIPVDSAQSISELSEALPWWRINQGGLQTNDSVIHGILIGAAPSQAEHLDDYNIVTKLGHAVEGKRGQIDTRIKAAKKSAHEKPLIGVIINANHTYLQSRPHISLRPDEKFMLMEFWTMTDFWIDWQEREQNKPKERVLMARLQKVTKDNIWWHSDDSRVEDAENPETQTCDQCQRESQKRYEEGWFCGHPDCPSSADDNSTSNLQSRTYTKTYLADRPQEFDIKDEKEYLPDQPDTGLTVSDLKEMLEDKTNTRPMWKSYYCESCGVFNQRTQWHQLECRNCHKQIPSRLPDLKFADVVEQQYLNVKDLNEQLPGLVENHGAQRIKAKQTSKHHVYCWQLYKDNRVWVLIPKQKEIAQVGVPHIFDNFFGLLQGGLFPLIRCGTSMKGGSYNHEDQLTAWFGHNVGVEYTHARMKLENTAFSDAPSILNEILKYLTDTVERTIDAKCNFNEMLCVGNYPKMRMNWHFDGEKDVIGDAVASISFGASAEMSFGVRSDSYKSGGADPDEPVIEGTGSEKEKVALRALLEGKKIKKGEYERQMKELIKKIRVPREPRPILTFPIPGTGAIMIQEGSTLNDYYVHRVVNKGLVRIVTTCRRMAEQKGEGTGEDVMYEGDEEEE